MLWLSLALSIVYKNLMVAKIGSSFAYIVIFEIIKRTFNIDKHM